MYPEHIGQISVHTPYGYKKVLAAEKVEVNSPTHHIKTVNHSLTCSPEHRIWSDGWKFAKDINIGDIVSTISGDEKIVISSPLETRQDLYDIQVEDVEQYYSNGILSHNSACLDSICFGLYGRTNRSVLKDRIVNWKNRKNCEVTVRFKIGANQYKVSRGIKPDFLEIYKDGKLIPQPPDVRQYQKMLETDILKIDYQMFVSLVHINLNHYVPFLQMDLPRKRAFIEKMFGLEMFSDLNRLVNEKLNMMENQLNIHNAENTLKSKLRSDAEHKASILKGQLRELRSSRPELKKVVDRLSKYSDTKGSMTALESSGAELERQKVDLDQQLTKLTTSIDFLDKERIAIEDSIIKKSRDIDQHRASRDRFKKIISENKNIDKKVELEQERLSIIEKELSDLNTKLNGYNISLAEAQVSLDHYTTNLHTLSGETECPVCMNKIDKGVILPNIQGLIDKNAEVVKTLTGDIEKSRSRVNVLENDRSHNTLDQLIKDRSQYHEARSKLENIATIIKSIDISSDRKRLVEINKDLDTYQIDQKVLAENLRKLKNLIEKNTQELTELKSQIESHDKLLTQKKVLEEKVAWEDKTKSDLQTQVKQIDEELVNLGKDLKRIDESVTKLSTLKDYVSYVKTLCKDDNVKQYAIASILPYLTKKINEYLSRAGMNYFVNFTKAMEDEIKGPGIYNASYSNLSGGEARSCDLAILFALLDISRTQFGVFPDFLLLDELLDSSVDSKGLDSVLKVVWLRQKEDNGKIYIVTHRTSDFTDLAELKMIRVEKEGGFSTISEIQD